jgi:hypothetical protein
VFVEYNYIVPTPYSAGSWEWYDHGHDGPPRVCRLQLHCTDTLQLQVLGSSTITATLLFVEYNYIVPTPYSRRFLGVVRSRLFYKHEGGRRGRDRTTPKNLRL